MLSDWDHKPIRTFLVKVLGQPPESALLEQDRLVIHVAAPPEPAHLCWREVPVPQHHMDVVAVISMAALDAHDVIKRSLVPPLGALHERAPRSADAGEVSRQMIVVIGQRVVCTLEAEQRKPKLQVVNGRSVYRCMLAPQDLILFLPVLAAVVFGEPRPQCTALLGQRSGSLTDADPLCIAHYHRPPSSGSGIQWVTSAPVHSGHVSKHQPSLYSVASLTAPASVIFSFGLPDTTTST